MRVEIGAEWVELRPEVTLQIGLAANRAIRRHGDDPEALTIALAQVYLRWGIEAWSFPEPVDPMDPEFLSTVERLLPFTKGGNEVVTKADALYSSAIIDPLVQRLSRSSPAGQTDASISPTRTFGTGLPTLYSRFSQPASAAGMPSDA